MAILRFYSATGLSKPRKLNILKKLQQLDSNVKGIRTEKCYHIELDSTIKPKSIGDSCPVDLETILCWLLKHPQDEISSLKRNSTIRDGNESHSMMIEIGPRFNFSTPSSTHSVSICHNIGLTQVKRIETSIIYGIEFEIPCNQSNTKFRDDIINILSDRMTQCEYTKLNLPTHSFNEPKLQTQRAVDKWYRIPIMDEGRTALEIVNHKLGLSFDNWDMDYYMDLFKRVLKRDPTSVELFDLAQSNSEHSRHWFFKGKLIIDNVECEQSLIQTISNTQTHSNQNNTIKFSDNSSAIHGFSHLALQQTNWTGPDKMVTVQISSDLIFTAETHNMPTAISPFSGATTGTGGRIRDVQAVGRGGHTIAGTAGYCVGMLNIPNLSLPFESGQYAYPPSFSTPLNIIIEASNGASDYGNKFGEPVISGFAISYGLVDHAGQRLEYVKPIMFSGGIGTMDTKHTNKIRPERGNLLAKIGGPVYRIGVGGGAASSVDIQGKNQFELDFNAVQRGDAQMENKVNRIVRACIELGDKNPILAIHDQGAGGNGNVLKELVEPGMAGAIIFSKEFELGDPTITALELWGAEYQENNAILCKPEDRRLLEAICERERCPINFVGVVTGSGYVTLIESHVAADNDFNKYLDNNAVDFENQSIPFHMHLKDVLGDDIPRKTFTLERFENEIPELELDNNGGESDKITDFNQYVMRVLGIMAVGSKSFLTNKVDRCVTGLIAQQQCVGPVHTPLSDYAVTAVSYFGCEGAATSIGTQPAKCTINPAAGARMCVAEALSNLVFVKVSALRDVKCSANWMWPAKLPGEGAKMYDACMAMCNLMNALGIAIDGGKDSLSMAAKVNDTDTIKSPDTLVISAYAPCPDINLKITPDFKGPSSSGGGGGGSNGGTIIWITIEKELRLGGSALAQTFGKQGRSCPDLNCAERLANAFNVTQQLLTEGVLLAGHDISDGGLIVCLLEMAFGGLCGFTVDLTAAMSHFNLPPFTNLYDDNIDNIAKHPAVLTLFAEECGWILEVAAENVTHVLDSFSNAGVSAFNIGNSHEQDRYESTIEVWANNQKIINGTTLEFLKEWERISFELEKLQMNEKCAISEYASLGMRKRPQYWCSFTPGEVRYTIDTELKPLRTIRVAVLREEGSNGDREMIATLMAADFEVHDVTMSDLLTRKTNLDNYRGLIFPGGFSYADTLGSAKGWAANIMCNKLLQSQFMHFKNRLDTFSLGVCNGCQLMCLMGWVGPLEPAIDSVEDFISYIPELVLSENTSERFECRWATVKIENSKSILFRDMVGTTMGCWVAHAEGRFIHKSEDSYQALVESNCISLSYVDDGGFPTDQYPMNPNGSPNGLAGVCSEDGRHLALMPHPERCTLMWQWPYVPPHFAKYKESPWQYMFTAAKNWCIDPLQFSKN